MEDAKSVKQWLDVRGLTADILVAQSGLDAKIVTAILAGQWTPSPKQRERIAAALGVSVAEIQWGHLTPVEHIYGHGPQFGRSP